MINKFPKLAVVLTTLALSACASGDYDLSDKNQFVSEFYAEVEQINAVEFDSQAGEAAVAGGVWGAIENADGNRENILGGAILGALFGGVITSIFEGSKEGYEYYLHAVDGDEVIVVLDHGPAEVGDCVRVRMSNEVKVYSADSRFCSRDQDY